MHEELKAKYKSDFTAIQKLVNAFDPCGLIKSGAPNDEYHVITNTILSSIYNKKSRHEIVDVLIYEYLARP